MMFLFPRCRNVPLTHAYVISGGKKVEIKVGEKSREKGREKNLKARKKVETEKAQNLNGTYWAP